MTTEEEAKKLGLKTEEGEEKGKRGRGREGK
jgi:hypothetical protein